MDIPRFPGYTASTDGSIVNRKGVALRPQRRSRVRKNQWRVRLVDEKGTRHNVTIARALCAAKYRRWPKEFEDACHIDGDPANNHMDNLRVACRINNLLDDVETGRLKTTKAYLLHAAQRCAALAMAAA